MKVPKYNSAIIMAPIRSIQKHEVIAICGERPLDEFWEKELDRYDLIRPVAVQNKETGILYIVRHAYLLDKATKEGEKEMELLVVDCPIGEAPRLYNYEAPLTAKRNYADTYGSMEYMNKYLKGTPEGRQFYNDLPGQQKRDKIAYLHGYRGGSIVTKILTIGRYAPNLLQEMDEGDAKLDDVYNTAVAIKREIDEEKASQAASKVPNRNCETPPAQPAPVWNSNSTKHPSEFTTTSTDASAFRETSVSEPPLEPDATKSQVAPFHAPTATPAPVFLKPSVSISLDDGKTLEADFSSHEIKMAINGVITQGFTHLILESDSTRTIQLFYKGAQAVTIAYNKTILNS